MLNFFLTWVLAAISLGITTSIVKGLAIASWQGAAIGVIVMVIVMRLVNAIVKPILKIIRLPVTILTLGIFRSVIIAIVLLRVGHSFPEYFKVDGFSPALLGAIVLSLVYGSIDWFVSGEEA